MSDPTVGHIPATSGGSSALTHVRAPAAVPPMPPPDRLVADVAEDEDGGLMTRVKVLEARVALLSLAVKSFVALIIGSFVAYLFKVGL